MVVTANPRVLQVMLPSLRRRHPDLLRAISENLQGFIQMLRAEVGDAAPPGGGGGGGEAGMPNEAQFRQLAAMMAENPAMLAQMMQSDPELQQAVQQNPQAFQQILQHAAAGGGVPGAPGGQGGGAAGGGGAPPRLALTEADNAAIERLCQLGFERLMATQAYIACEKNEELAANLLFDGGVEDEGMPDQGQ